MVVVVVADGFRLLDFLLHEEGRKAAGLGCVLVFACVWCT